MKNYEQPAIELIKFSLMDVIMTSLFDTVDPDTQLTGDEIVSGAGDELGA